MSENEQHAARLERLIGMTEVLLALDSDEARDALVAGAAALREIDTLRNIDGGGLEHEVLVRTIDVLHMQLADSQRQLTDALTTLTAIRDQTYTDAAAPELRAQNEANHRRAVEVLARMGER